MGSHSSYILWHLVRLNMTDDHTPRVNSQLIGQYASTGRVVRLIGKVKSVQGATAQLEAPDGGAVMVRRRHQQPYQSSFVEVMGNVNDDRSIDEQAFTECGENFDLKVYNDLVLVANSNFKDMFGPQ